MPGCSLDILRDPSHAAGADGEKESRWDGSGRVSVSNAIRVQWALVSASAVLALLTVVMREDLLRDWAESRGGLEFVQESQLSLPSFAPVAVVSFVVYAALAWVLVVMFRHGHGWARWSLLALAASFLFAALVIFRAVAAGAVPRRRSGRGGARRGPDAGSCSSAPAGSGSAAACSRRTASTPADPAA